MPTWKRLFGNFTSHAEQSIIKPIIRNGASFQLRFPGPASSRTFGGCLEFIKPEGSVSNQEGVVSLNSEQVQVWNRNWGQSTGRLSLLSGVRQQPSSTQEQGAYFKGSFYKLFSSISNVIPLGISLVPPSVSGSTAPTVAVLHSFVHANDAVPHHHAYQLGGPLSIRGFFTGELGVPTTSVTGTAELRVPVKISSTSEVTAVAFIDYGIFDSPQNGKRQFDVAWAHGIGMKAGIFQLDYAVTDTGVSRIHFGLANPFL